MATNELVAFRERWKRELNDKKGESRLSAPSSSRENPDQFGQNRLNKTTDTLKREGSSDTGDTGSVGVESDALKAEDQPQYVSIAHSLLDGRTSPLLDRIREERTRRKRQYNNMTNICAVSLQQQQQQQERRKVKKEEELVDQLIQDLNEVNDIPFFDVELPYELALKIFQYLNRTELGRCAQVSRAWRVLAEDGVLWFRLCQREGYHQGDSVSNSPCWKSTLRDCRNSARTVRSNWKNRVGSVRQLQFELGKILCDVTDRKSVV